MVVSIKNSKLGRIPNTNLLPVVTCAKNLPCYKACYAQKAVRQYPLTRIAWKYNTKLAKTDPVQYFAEIEKFFAKRSKPVPYFRWHSAGDYIDQDYLNRTIQVAINHPETKFLAFTKKHGLDYSCLPSNYVVYFSMWTNWGNDTDMPKAYYQDGSETRVKRSTFHCVGDCRQCKHCWDKKTDVVFIKH
jgi:hypothetical protein